MFSDKLHYIIFMEYISTGEGSNSAVIDIDGINRYKSNYHVIVATIKYIDIVVSDQFKYFMHHHFVHYVI
jgi:hypothetical protein